MNTESRRLEGPPQSGQFAWSSISLIRRSFSKVSSQIVQVYSYTGILLSSPDRSLAPLFPL